MSFLTKKVNFKYFSSHRVRLTKLGLDPLCQCLVHLLQCRRTLWIFRRSVDRWKTSLLNWNRPMKTLKSCWTSRACNIYSRSLMASYFFLLFNMLFGLNIVYNLFQLALIKPLMVTTIVWRKN